MASGPEHSAVHIIEPSPADRLDSWKQIAGYFGRSERTVRRWEQSEGLPVHRHAHEKRGSVYAYKPELDAWWNGRRVRLEQEKPSRRPILWVAAALGVLALAAAGAWRIAGTRPIVEESLKAVPLTSYPGLELYPSLSPDGKQVAFSWNGDSPENFDIYIKSIDGGGPLRLTTDPMDEFSPAWSPDGRSIAFLRVPVAGAAALWIKPPLAGAEKKVADVFPPPRREGFYGGYLAWSPDGKWLAVHDKSSPEDRFALFLVSVETGEKRRLTAPPRRDMAPAFSPDGRALAFVRILSFAVSELHVLSLTENLAPKGEPKALTSTRQFTASPVWTPDGREILFTSGDVWGGELWRIAASGQGKPKRIASVGQDISVLAVSGGRLVYSRTILDANIWQVGRHDPLISSTRVDFNPQLSPDGKRISFDSNRSGNTEIWISDRDGSNPVQLTSMGGSTGAARWSPDAERIVFNSRPEGHADLYVIPAAGGTPRRLTTEPSNDSLPSWSRDGRWIYFFSNRSGGGQIWKMPADGGAAVQVTRQGGLAAVESTDGRYVYYSKGGTGTWGSSLWRVPAAGGEETPLLESLQNWNAFAVVEDGVYFIPTAHPRAVGSLEFFRFSDGKSEHVASISKPAFVGVTVFPLAAGRPRSILYAQIDREDSDLMLVEHFGAR